MKTKPKKNVKTKLKKSHWTKKEIEDHAAIIARRQLTEKKLEVNNLERFALEAQLRMNEKEIAINAGKVESFYWKNNTNKRRMAT